MSLYKNKYRNESSRKQGWDYSSPGYYFITICTKNRIPYFGEIQHAKMEFFEMGFIARSFWLEIPHHFPNVVLDEFVIMPDHIHGILEISNRGDGVKIIDRRDGLKIIDRRDGACPVPTKICPVHTIGNVIAGYKSAVTKYAHRMGYEFAWQSRFHDRIIRNQAELNRFRKYITENPLRG